MGEVGLACFRAQAREFRDVHPDRVVGSRVGVGERFDVILRLRWALQVATSPTCQLVDFKGRVLYTTALSGTKIARASAAQCFPDGRIAPPQ